MPKIAREMTALEVRQLDRPGFHAVGGVAGLLIQVTESGAKSWVLRTLVGNRRRSFGLGSFPEVSLKEAREKAREMREQVRQGIDPAAERRARRNALIQEQAREMTFREAAKACHAAKASEFRNPKHRRQWISTLEHYAFPKIGNLLVSEVELPHVLSVLQPIWHTKTETATRIRQRIESVLTWATVSGYRRGENPARWKGNLAEVLPTPNKIAKAKHHKAVAWQQAPEVMAALRQREGMAARALEFCILTAARSGEVRGATWDEIDLEAQVWTVPGDRIKKGKRHTVPLNNDAVKLLKALPRIAGTDYVFPAPRGGKLSDMSLSAVLKRMDIDATVHGFRSTFKDWARNRTNYPDEVSELALAHVNSDATRAAYARDELLPQRKWLMTDWAKYLREPVESTTVTPIKGQRHVKG